MLTTKTIESHILDDSVTIILLNNRDSGIVIKFWIHIAVLMNQKIKKY